ncbi:hypothetical protein N9A94_05800 [Akkermansiaceae bacterium]|nr:hypothetical protein [Akkermansiaceae bacterium]MDB4544464.1 hypothetical protein [Akkermansiaceae bacterium]
MDWLTGAIWLPLIGAALHPILGWCVQQGTAAGVRLTIIVAVANLVTTAIFFAYLQPDENWALQGKDWWAIGNGVLFFFGQWFSTRSVKAGDLAVHSSALGGKVVVVGFFSILVGLEAPSWNLLTGVILAVIAVFLAAGASLEGWRRHRVTVGLTMLACFFFGINDFLTGWQSREIGVARWLILMMGTGSLISIGLLVLKRSQIRIIFESPRAGYMVLGAGLALGVQALVVNMAFSTYGQPTLSNVAYSSRGVMAVAFLYLIGKQMDKKLARRQTAGAILMMAALAIVLL